MQAMIQKAVVSPNTNQNIGNKNPQSEQSWNNKKSKVSSKKKKFHKGHKCKAKSKYRNNVNDSKAHPKAPKTTQLNKNNQDQ